MRQQVPQRMVMVSVLWGWLPLAVAGCLPFDWGALLPVVELLYLTREQAELAFSFHVT